MDELNGTTQAPKGQITRRQLLASAGAAGFGAVGLGLLGGTSVVQAAMGSGTAADNLNRVMRKLWEQHVWWTRLYIVTFAANVPETTPTAQRLLRNQVDIGNAIKPFYGNAAGNQLTALLKQHILGAVAILTAAKAGNTMQVNQATTAWFANANQIAAFLHGANPMHWPLGALRMMMHRHLTLTLREATAELHGSYGASIAAFGQVEQEILQMADTLTAGIVAQFPGRFPG